MLTFLLQTPREVQMSIRDYLKSKRKSKKISMNNLSTMSGVSLGTLKRFESTSEISLDKLLMIAQSLGCLNKFVEISSKDNDDDEIMTMQELLELKSKGKKRSTTSL